MDVGQIATKRVVTVSVADSCETAVALMERHSFRHLPVLDGETPVGMLSERDLLFHLYWLGSDGGVETIHEHVASTSTPVGEIMSTPLITVAPKASLKEAAWLMLQQEVRSLPLVRENRLQGLVTETDLLKRFAEDESEEDWQQRLTADYMARPVAFVPPQKPTVEALRLMGEEHVRHLPVVDGGRVVGIISDRDIFRGCAKHEETEKRLGKRLQRNQENLVQSMMTQQVETAEPATPLAVAARTMAVKKIGALPVMDEQMRLVGLLTETDILRALLEASEE